MLWAGAMWWASYDDSSIIDMIGEPNNGGLKSVDIKNVETNEITNYNCDGLFLGIGHTPNSKIFVDQLKLDESGYIITNSNSSKTSIDGVFAAGDIMDPVYRQAITAAGTGCMAALDAEKFLDM